MTDPTLTVKNLLASGDYAAATDLGEQPAVHTGAYDRAGAKPAVAVGFDADEGPLSGGATGYTATDNTTGKGMQRLSGYVMIEAGAGTRAECDDVGPNGTAMNPKAVRWALYQHAAQVVTDAQESGDLFSLAVNSGTALVDTSGADPDYSYQFRVRYLRDRLPSGSNAPNGGGSG